MLKYKNSLCFPELIFVKNVQFKSRQDKGTTNTYVLDWSNKDKKVKRGHEEWLKRLGKSPKEIPCYYKLPKNWEYWIQKFVYAIPTKYYEEISEQCHLAIIEWNKTHPFDTVIRDVCVESAIAHVATAFALIADCVYDEKTNNFYRGDDKFAIKHALMYRFWIGQTGGGLLRDHSKFQQVSNLLNTWYSVTPEDQVRNNGKIQIAHALLDDIGLWEKQWESSYIEATKDILPKETQS